MAFKPSDFFVGVIDFFAVLPPGAIIVALGYPHVPPFVLGEHGIVPPIEGETVQWIAFIVSAYRVALPVPLCGAPLEEHRDDVPIHGRHLTRPAPLARWGSRETA
jgi:hypothetical protein